MAANGGIKGKLNKPSHGGNAVTTMTASGNFVTQQGTTEVDVLTVAGGGALEETKELVVVVLVDLEI